MITEQSQSTAPVPDQPPALSIDGSVATITLCRPAVANRLSVQDLHVLQEHFSAVEGTEAVRVLRIVGTGKYFCSGFDISSLADPAAASSLLFGETVDKLESLRPVTVAVLQGGVYGGATDLALACDFRVGSHNTNMFMPATQLGLHFYPGGLRRYVERLGVDQAKRLFLRATRLDATQMLQCGYLTDLFEAQSLEAEVEALTETLTGMAPLALIGVKHHLNQIAQGKFDKAAIERNVLASENSADIQEGATAWKEKRKPRFEGR